MSVWSCLLASRNGLRKSAGPDIAQARAREVRWQLEHMTADVRAALRRLPALGEDSAGPLGSGLLASGVLGMTIRDLQVALSGS